MKAFFPKKKKKKKKISSNGWALFLFLDTSTGRQINRIFLNIYTHTDPDRATGGPDPLPPAKSHGIWVSLGNMQLDPLWKTMTPHPTWKMLHPLWNLKHDNFL